MAAAASFYSGHHFALTASVKEAFGWLHTGMLGECSLLLCGRHPHGGTKFPPCAQRMMENKACRENLVVTEGPMALLHLLLSANLLHVNTGLSPVF